jgi:hypothetical protein
VSRRTNHRGGPQPIAGFEKATAAAAGMRYHVSPGTGLLCAIVEGGAVSCATIGETGPGVSKDHIDTPKLVAGIRNATRIAVARDSACALAGSEVRCWGANNRGQLGDGTRIDRPEPVVVENLLSDTLPTPRDGNDAVPESNVKMSWDGIPAACKRSPSFNFDRARFEKPEIAFEVRSAYAWEWNGKLQIRLANYQVDPVREVAEPRGLQQYIVMTLEKNDKHDKPLRPDRGTYAIGDTARELSLYRRTMDTDSFVTQGDQEVELTHVDKQWVCGVFRYPDRNDNPIVSTFAARVIAVKR